jgi:ankyrin repeat protein
MYKMLAQDHPGSVGKILRHLLNKVKAMALELNLPRNLSILRAGSVFDYSFRSGTKVNMSPSNRQAALTAVEDLVKMHMEKQRDDQTTRLLFAASRGDTATIELMCDQGFDANNADYDNRTALMVAAMKGNTDVAKLLLDKYNANPNLTDIHNSTALMEAVKNARDDTMELLLQHDAKLCMKDSLAASMLCQTVMDGDILFLRRMLQANINVNAADYDKRTAAHIAAAEGNVAALRVLVEFGADLKRKDRWENKLYDEAVRANAGKMLEYLKALKETPSTATDSIHDLVKMYSEKQKDDKTTRLLFAAWRDDTATVEALCDEGFDANNADYDNRTALMIASMKGNTAVVELLLEKYNADPNLCDVHGSTALMEAVKNAHEDTMEILMKNGAKLLIKESLAASMLCETVMEGDILFLKRLLKAGINVNTVDYDKRTAGHIAAAEGNIAALKVLIDAGADLSLKDRWNNSLNDEALRANAGMMINYLKSLEESCQATSND